MHGYHSLSQFNIKQCLQNLIGLENLRVEVKDLYLKDQLQSFFSPKLDTLSVSGENLRSVSSSAFAGMLSPVIKIQLSHTSIDTFNDKIFLPLPLSSKIEFSVPHNKIKRLTSEMLAVLDNKQVDIAIYGINLNPIICDCHLNFLWNWLHDKTKTSNDQHQEDISLNDFICSEPDRLQGKKLKELAISDLICEDSSVTKVTDVSVDSSTSYFPTSLKETTSLRDHPYIIFEQPVTKRPSVPLSYVPAGGNRSALTKVDTMIIGIVAGVVAFVCILIIIICIIRLRRAHPLYTAGPLAGPLAFRAQGKCTCLKPPSSNCTCYPMYSVPYPGGRPSLLQNAQHKMLPPSLPAPPGFLNSGQSGRLRNTPYYVTYPDSDNENK
ncbi:Slit-like protein, partial [Stegodyphus mimosarum]